MTIIELVVVAVIAALLTAVAIVFLQPSQANVSFQANQLRDDIRHMQSLAVAWQQQLMLVASASGYQVECVTKSQANTPCSAASGPVIDPATEAAFAVSNFAANGVSWNPLPSSSLAVDKLGRPLNAGGTAVETASNRTFTLAGGGQTGTVTMVHTTGFVSAP